MKKQGFAVGFTLAGRGFRESIHCFLELCQESLSG